MEKENENWKWNLKMGIKIENQELKLKMGIENEIQEWKLKVVTCFGMGMESPCRVDVNRVGTGA